MSAALAVALMILVIGPAIAGVVIGSLVWLDRRGAPDVVCIAVPYLLACGLALLVAWPIAAAIS